MVNQYRYNSLKKRGLKHKKTKKHYRHKSKRHRSRAGTVSHCIKYRDNPVKCNTIHGCVYSAKNKQCRLKSKPTRKPGQTSEQYNSYVESLLTKARNKNRSHYRSSYMPSAAVTVQRQTRGRLARSKLSRLHASATKIQRNIRRKSSRKSSRKHLHTAATKIQRATRQRNRNKNIQVTVTSTDGKDSIYKLSKNKLILDLKTKLSETTENSIFNMNLFIPTSEQPITNDTPLYELLDTTARTNQLELFLVLSDILSEPKYVIDTLEHYIPNFLREFFYGNIFMHNPELELIKSIAYHPE